MRPEFIVSALAAAQGAAGRTIATRQVSGALDSPEQFALFAQYSFSSYCKQLHDTSLNTPVCTNSDKTPCPNFENATTVAEFAANDRFQIGGFVAKNPGQQHIAVVFKGTDSAGDIATDAAIDQIDSDLCEGCKVHKGFGRAFNGIQGQLEQTIKTEKAVPGQENWRLVVTGHSLGAGVATIAGSSLRKQGMALDMYLYGSPLVGNDKFAKFVSSQGGGFTARITNARDPVTAIPKNPLSPKTYKHISPEFWFADGVEGPQGLYTTSRQVCSGEKDCTSASCAKLSKGLLLSGCNFTDHTRYAADLKPCDGLQGSTPLDIIPGLNDTLEAAKEKKDKKKDKKKGKSRERIVHLE
ncbi:Triacylglycerol lipase, partial [Metarhizium majus ARSEF 297]